MTNNSAGPIGGGGSGFSWAWRLCEVMACDVSVRNHRGHLMPLEGRMRPGAFPFYFQLFLKRLVCYEKPYRVALVKYFSLVFKTFRPHYESIVFEACVEAKKLGFKDISVVELGVAGGNGILALEKYKDRIEKVLGINIHIYGFDLGCGLPEIKVPEDLPFKFKEGQFSTDIEVHKEKFRSKIFYGDIKDTVGEFIKTNPATIGCVFVDLDLYTSTVKFLSQIPKLEKVLLPRTLFYFDDIFDREYHVGQFNGELKAINEFNDSHDKFKLSSSIDHIIDYKFPLAKGSIFTLHSFHNKLYNKYIGTIPEDITSLGSKKLISLLD